MRDPADVEPKRVRPVGLDQGDQRAAQRASRSTSAASAAGSAGTATSAGSSARASVSRAPGLRRARRGSSDRMDHRPVSALDREDDGRVRR